MSRTDHGNKQNQHQDGIRSCCCQQVYGMIKNCASVRHEWAEREEAGEGMGADQGRLDPKGEWQVENAKWKGEGGALRIDIKAKSQNPKTKVVRFYCHINA